MRVVVGVLVIAFLFSVGYYFFLRNPQILPEDASCCGNSILKNTLSGKKIYLKNCASCHGINGRGTGIAPKLSERNLSKKYIKKVVANGKGRMRALSHINNKELHAIFEFISSLK